jgi:DnaJ-class molecular chaperone
MEVPRFIICPSCDGNGEIDCGEGIEVCDTCEGTGKIEGDAGWECEYNDGEWEI